MPNAFTDRRILIADDEPTVIEMLVHTVRSCFNCHIDAVPDGDEALRMLHENKYDVFVTDMLMPGCHGLDLISQVVSSSPEVDILVVTAYPGEFPYVSVIQAGAADFIRKPFLPQELEAKLVRIFKERHLREEILLERERILADMEAMEALRAEQAVAELKYRSIFELSMEGMAMLETSGARIRDANRAFCALCGRTRDELVGTAFVELLDIAERERVQQGMLVFSRSGQGALAAVPFRGADGRERSLDLSITYIQVGTERIVLLACKDVTDQLEIQRQLGAIAQMDEMTGLLNYRSFSISVEAAITRARSEQRPLTLMFIDLDNFKHCNDTYGHQTGDALLRSVGQIIRDQTRTSDKGFRYGGDEFAVLLQAADASVGLRVAERMRLDYALAEQHGTSMSIGIAQFVSAMDASAFVRCADEALYKAKAAGKNAIRVA